MLNLLQLWSKKLMYLYKRMIIFSHRQIRDRVRIYLRETEHSGEVVEMTMNRTEWADYLGVDRTALSRELGKLQAEGIIEVEKRRIRLLDKDFFDERE